MSCGLHIYLARPVFKTSKLIFCVTVSTGNIKDRIKYHKLLKQCVICRQEYETGVRGATHDTAATPSAPHALTVDLHNLSLLDASVSCVPGQTRPD